MGEKIDFEAEGLLEGLEGDDREARIELLEQLVADGASLDELKEASRENRLVLLPVERLLKGPGRRLTRAELAEETGLDDDFLRRLSRALGLPDTESDEPAFPESDLPAVKAVATFREAGMSDKSILSISRVMGRQSAQLAMAIRGGFREAFTQEGDNERDLGLRYAAAARELTPQLEPVLATVLNMHLREMVKNEVIERTELASGQLGGAKTVSVAFADLVGFTKLGEQIPPDDLGEIAGRLTDLAMEVAEPPVRLVKMIGDAAMLVAPEPDPLIDAALALVNCADEEGEHFPQVHAGLALGEALEREGDWYGRPVNLASRLAAVAYPGSVLATNEVCDASDGGYAWSRAGRKKFKGVDDPVGVMRVRRESRDE